MPDFRRQICRLNRNGCGKNASIVGPISWRGLCIECAKRHVVDNADGLRTMTGPAVVRWRRGMAASVGAVLADDLAALLPDDG
jgi:hypothetical protein